MGMDLRLLIFPEIHSKVSWWLAVDQIRLKRDYDLFDYFGLDRDDRKNQPVVKLKEIPADNWLEIYSDDGIEEIKNDPYGGELKYFFAEDIKEIPDDVETSDWNKAIIIFLKNLPPKSIITPYWC